MVCPRCRMNNPEDANFCMKCGQSLASNGKTLVSKPVAPLSLPAAPSLAVPIKTFVPKSSDSLAQRAGERRVVTMLFADISGFTALSENMDPEQVRSLINRCFDHLVPIVEKYGGIVDKFIGDEIMALFGAPVAHEDDPARALQAVLDMMDALVDFNRQQDTDLGLHAGVNTGLVVAGGIGSRGRRQYSVMGDAVNLAARLEDASERGEVLLGPDTYRFVAPLFDCEALSPLRLKGKAEPVQVYKLLGKSIDPGRVRGLTGLASQMVGRDAELATLTQLSESVQPNQGHIALIIGEAGLGKSRLIAEWRASQLTSKNGSGQLRWVAGGCLSYGQGLAYHLVIDMVRAGLRLSAGASEMETQARLWSSTKTLFGEATDEIYPYLAHLLSLDLDDDRWAQAGPLEPQMLQNHYLNVLRQLLVAMTKHRPAGLIFEDIHWADPSSTELLVQLLPLVADLPILFCFVTRPDFDAPGWRLVTAAQQSFPSYTTEINLQTLSDIHSRELVSNLLEIESLPEHIRTLILKRAEGNPFFVEEVIRMLIDREAIIQEGHRWVACEQIETVEIPDNLQGLLLARIDRLPDNIKQTLRVASVIGRQFSVKVLDEVLQTVQNGRI